MSSFIVEFWSQVFSLLGKLSLFSLIRWLRPNLLTARFVDAWVPVTYSSVSRSLSYLSCHSHPASLSSSSTLILVMELPYISYGLRFTISSC